MPQAQRALSRRRFIAGSAGAAASAFLGPVLTGGTAAAATSAASPPSAANTPSATSAPGATSTPGAASTPSAGGWYVPADHVPHERTWMAWPARRDVWGSLLPGVRRDIARIARAIAHHEPVSMIARPDQAAGAAAACGRNVDVVQLVNDDLWMRDIGPVFLVNDRGALAGLGLNFNGWGKKQVHTNDARIADGVLSVLGLRRFNAPFTSEGGALEFDGDETAIATESSIINPNRNPGQSKAQLTRAICDYTGASKVVWVPGLRGHDITDDHIDSLAVFVKPGVLAVDQPADAHATGPWAASEKRALQILSGSHDAHGRRFACHISRESARIPPGQNPNQFVNVYVNWYVANGAVFLPGFADSRSDAAARALAARLYPDREVVQLRIDNLAAGGGGIHCATQQQPRARRSPPLLGSTRHVLCDGEHGSPTGAPPRDWASGRAGP